jgi:hypothetical protein
MKQKKKHKSLVRNTKSIYIYQFHSKRRKGEGGIGRGRENKLNNELL